MHFRVLQSYQLDCLFVRGFGRYQAPDISLLSQHFRQLELFKSGAPVVADARFVDFDVPTESITLVSRMPVLPPQQSERCLAFVAGSDLGYGMLRVMAALRERERQITNVFWSFGEAFEWIGRPEMGNSLPPEVDRMLDDHAEDAGQHERFSIQIGRV